MRKLLLTSAILSLCNCLIISQSYRESGSFLLHKFAQNIGKEKYTVEKTDSGLRYQIDFKFVDRGAAVPLTAVMIVQSNLDPASLQIKGRSSRFSVINDTVFIRGNKAMITEGEAKSEKTIRAPVFPVAGYSPGTVQMLMLQYWKMHGSPASLDLLPSGSVKISKDGLDSFSFNGKSIVLDRFVISGLIWGNELAWTDNEGQLYCLITNDAEGDKLEMMLEPYESLLPMFISKAAVGSMQLFSNLSKTSSLHPRLIAIKGGTVIDVINNKEIPNTLIIIEDGIIKSIGPIDGAKVPTNAHIIDANGKFILPGLWDMHAHVEQAEWGPAYLAAGVTTVRDCGNEFEYINAVKSAIDEGRGIGPHILKAGIIDGKGPIALGVIQATTKEDAIAAVHRYKENGFEQIKIYSSVKPQVVKYICDEAHRLGLTVTGHIPEGMTIVAGVDSGMDMVNHIEFVYEALKVNKQNQTIDFADSSNKSLFDFLKKKHVVIDPTLSVFEMVFRNIKDSFSLIEPAFAHLPPPLQTLLASTGMPPERAKTLKPLMDNLKKVVKELNDRGIPVVAGTDMGAPGFSVFREIELYVEGGMLPIEALQTATIIPARVMKKDMETGSVTAGKKADIIIVDGNPREQISKIRNTLLVLKDGNIYDPVALHRMVGFSQ